MIDSRLSVPPAVHGHMVLPPFQGHLYDTVHMVVSGSIRRHFLDLSISVPDWRGVAFRSDQRPFPDERAPAGVDVLSHQKSGAQYAKRMASGLYASAEQ